MSSFIIHHSSFIIFSTLLLTAAAPLRADARSEPRSIPPAELDTRIDEVLEHPRYAWRLPREASSAEEGGRGLLFDLEQTFSAVLVPVWNAVKALFEWIEDYFRKQDRPDESSGFDAARWIGISKTALHLLTAAAAVLIAWLLLRRWRSRRAAPVVVATAIIPAPDLASEDLVADQLPEDEWMRLATEMIARGELRLALRALYLAGLAHLGRRELITVARHKSDTDYDRELRRRARHQPDLLAAFERNVAAFERVWYGRHEPTAAHLDAFAENLSLIRAC